MTTAPEPRALAAFALTGTPEPLDGGQGRAWAVDGVVLRPADDPDVDRWTAATMADVREDGFRVPRPVPSASGDWVAEGWTAWERATGEHRTWNADWPAALEAAVRFHRALAPVPRPAFLARRTHVFAVADRVAWGEVPPPDHERLGPVLRRLTQSFRPVARPPQLVHADLAGNLLWSEQLPPAVIDLSPMWRPAGLGAAQLVVDAALWYGADVSLADRLLEIEPAAHQLVLRALVSRLAVDAQLSAGVDGGVRWEESHLDWNLEHAGPIAAWATGSPF